MTCECVLLLSCLGDVRMDVGLPTSVCRLRIPALTNCTILRYEHAYYQESQLR